MRAAHLSMRNVERCRTKAQESLILRRVGHKAEASKDEAGALVGRMQKQRCGACFEAPPFRAAHLNMRGVGGCRAVDCGIDDVMTLPRWRPG
ncbi:hypothetical protein EFQ99_32125 [Rhizobium vallis]|uniref:Uncharacterized protein n=1 Tax=Rhizobium vallis TaxID=634290 RepID=A0A3S0QKW2_9HYPH|nr:hypothetical protein EFQ99_32125 [Rhizobium vallis]